MFSRACEYAIQALIHLAGRPAGGYVTVREVASKSDIPFHFLGKIVQQLTKRGVLIANKGPGGGITLAGPADEINLLQVVDAVDGLDDIATRCVIGYAKCNDENPCPLHSDWEKNRKQILDMLTRTTLGQLARKS